MSLARDLNSSLKPAPEDQDLRRVGVAGEEGLVARVDHRQVKQDLLHAVEPARTVETAESGLPTSRWMTSRSRADVLTVAIRSSTSTRPQ